MELIFDERASKGAVKDYWTSVNNGTTEYKDPPYMYDILMDMVEADPSLFAATSLTVDLATHKGYSFEGKNARDIERAQKLFDDTLDFDEVIDNILWQLLIYGDAYLEVRWNQSKTEVKELNPLETTEMVLNYDEHGEISEYIQQPKGKGKEHWIRFKPDEVIYFRHYWVGTQVQSRSPFKSISRSYAAKVDANNYLRSLFRNVPPKIVYFLKNANEKQRKLFIENLVRAKTNPNMDIIAQGEAFESKVLQSKFDDGLMPILAYLQKQVLMVTRVPPHWIGMLEGANRGIGENVVIPYETKIKKIQQKVASQLSKELLPKLKLSNLKFKWNPISLLDEKTIVEIMNTMKAMMMDGETIIEYGRDHGLELRAEAEIENPMEDMIENGVGGAQKQSDNAPSRKGADKKNGSMTSTVNQKGVSEAGGKKLESKKQVMT